MGLGWHATVYRLDTDDATRLSEDGADVVERLRRKEFSVCVGAGTWSEGCSFVGWLRKAEDEGDGLCVGSAGGFPDAYIVRAGHCPGPENAELPAREWLYVELWDEG